MERYAHLYDRLVRATTELLGDRSEEGQTFLHLLTDNELQGEVLIDAVEAAERYLAEGTKMDELKTKLDERIEIARTRMQVAQLEGQSRVAATYGDIKDELTNLRRWLDGEFKDGQWPMCGRMR